MSPASCLDKLKRISEKNSEIRETLQTNAALSAPLLSLQVKQ